MWNKKKTLHEFWIKMDLQCMDRLADLFILFK